MNSIQQQLNCLEALGVRYAFHFQPSSGAAFTRGSREPFPSASLIKVPILLAWLHLEAAGQVERSELCDLDAEAQVQGAGLSWLLATRQLPFQDVLMLMITLSDNLCTNLVIRKIGLERLQDLFSHVLALPHCRLERKLFDYAARARGLDNWISADDCLQLYALIAALPEAQRAWVESLLENSQDDALLKRAIPRDTLCFFHKTGSISGILHDWGYTRAGQVFLLTDQVRDEPAVFEIFGELGKLTLMEAGWNEG